MLKVAVILVKLVIVQQLREADGAGVILVLQTGEQPLLRSTNASYEYYRRLALRSEERKRPVGVAIRDNEVQQVILADQDTVRDLVDNDPKFIKILFQGHDGIYSLDRSRPGATQIRALLEGSKRNQSSLWFAAKIPSLEIWDMATDDQLGVK